MLSKVKSEVLITVRRATNFVDRIAVHQARSLNQQTHAFNRLSRNPHARLAVNVTRRSMRRTTLLCGQTGGAGAPPSVRAGYEACDLTSLAPDIAQALERAGKEGAKIKRAKSGERAAIALRERIEMAATSLEDSQPTLSAAKGGLDVATGAWRRSTRTRPKSRIWSSCRSVSSSAPFISVSTWNAAFSRTARRWARTLGQAADACCRKIMGRRARCGEPGRRDE